MLLARGGAPYYWWTKERTAPTRCRHTPSMPGAVLQLDRWGVLPEVVAAGTPAVHSTTFCYAESQVTVPIEPRHGVTGCTLRGECSYRLLVDAAFESGVDVRYGFQGWTT